MITVSSHASTGANILSTNVADCLSVKKTKKKEGKSSSDFLSGAKHKNSHWPAYGQDRHKLW